jgi:hypothetical protein
MATCGSADACPSIAVGWEGQGAEFHGAGECLVVPHGRAFADFSGFTVSAWIRLVEPGGTTNRMIVGKPYGEANSNSFELYVFDVAAADGLLQGRFAISDGVEAATATAPAQSAVDVWTHVAGTWDGMDVVLWIDGMPVATQPFAAFVVDDNDLRIGCDDDLGVDPFDNVFVGTLDEVRLYREALDPEQIAALAVGDEP